MGRRGRRRARCGFRPPAAAARRSEQTRGAGKACPSAGASAALQAEEEAHFPPPAKPRSSVILVPPRRHVGARARPRDASGSVSRDLPTLAGPCWQSGCAGWRIPGFRGPGTCNSFSSRQVVREGPGRAPGRREPSRARRPVARGGADRPSGPPRSSRPRAPATCRALPRRPRGQPAPADTAPSAQVLPASAQLPFSKAFQPRSLLCRLAERRASPSVWASLTHLAIEKFSVSWLLTVALAVFGIPFFPDSI